MSALPTINPDGYTREGFLRLLHERLAAAHLAGRDNEGFPVSSLKLLMHYFDQLGVQGEAAIQAELDAAIEDVTEWLDHADYTESDVRPSIQRLNAARLRLIVARRRANDAKE